MPYNPPSYDGVFVGDDGHTCLFFQGNNDHGRTWFLSRVKIAWDGDKPHVIR
jgi:hypothetical protein